MAADPAPRLATGQADASAVIDIAVPLDASTLPSGSRIGQLVMHAARSSPLATPDIEFLLKQARPGGHLRAFICSAPPSQPAAGSLFLIDKQAAPHFLNDGHTWAKRDRHVKLRVATVPKLACYYSKSAGAMGTEADEQAAPVERRRYWLLEHRDLVLVHYLGAESSRRQPPEEASSSAAPPSLAPSAGKRPRGSSDGRGRTAKRSRGEALEAGPPGALPSPSSGVGGEEDGSCSPHSSLLDGLLSLDKPWTLEDLGEPVMDLLAPSLDLDLDLDLLLSDPTASGATSLFDAGLDPFANFIF